MLRILAEGKLGIKGGSENVMRIGFMECPLSFRDPLSTKNRTHG
jgi:hypothetical protein